MTNVPHRRADAVAFDSISISFRTLGLTSETNLGVSAGDIIAYGLQRSELEWIGICRVGVRPSPCIFRRESLCETINVLCSCSGNPLRISGMYEHQKACIEFAKTHPFGRVSRMLGDMECVTKSSVNFLARILNTGLTVRSRLQFQIISSEPTRSQSGLRGPDYSRRFA